jgi:hypothetical protein
MDQSNEPNRESFQNGETWQVDEPGYGYGPLDSFEASYNLDGSNYPVTIQGFFKDPDNGDSFRYRVNYRSGEEKILDYVLGAGFVEEGIGQTSHSRALGPLIEEHFSK